MNALPTSTPFSRLLVGFASESGNARALAQRLGAGLQLHGPQVLPFNDIDVASLGHGDVLLAISSSFGDGEPPANGEQFFETLRQTPTLAGLRGQIKTAGLADGLHIDARDGRWHLQVQAVPADALWNWLLPLLADPAIELQQLQLTRTGDANMPAARISGNIVMVATAGAHP